MYQLTILLFLHVFCQDDDPIHTSIIYGSSDLGYYFVNLYVGTPPQRQSVIIDTGSSITTFPCDACKSCGRHLDSYFDRDESQTLIPVGCESQIGPHKCDRCSDGQCIFSISYAEGSSLYGFFLTDQIIFGDLLPAYYEYVDQTDPRNKLSVKGVFGCTTLETNLFFTQSANGIMGLSPKTNTEFAYPNVADDIHTQQTDMANFFSICIGRLDGYMTIGQYDKARHQANSAYYTIPYSNKRDLYSVKISRIKVNERTISAGADLQADGGSFIDSGSTLVNANRKVFNSLVSNFVCDSPKCPQGERSSEGLYCYKYDESIHGSFTQFAQLFPTYSFIMEGNFIFEWTPINYLTKDLIDHDAYCLPVAEYIGSSKVILGQVWMRNWDIGFDKDNQTITFVKSNCSSDPIKHNFTAEDWINQEKKQINESEKKRRIPRDNVQEFVTEALKVGIVIVITFIIILIVIICRRRRMMKAKKKGEKLSEIDEDQSKQKQNVVVVQ